MPSHKGCHEKWYGDLGTGTPGCVFGTGDLGTQGLGCRDTCMGGRGDAGMWGREDVGMWGREDVGMWGREDVGRREDVGMRECEIRDAASSRLIGDFGR